MASRTIHVSEAEAAAQIRLLLAEVTNTSAEVIIERENRPVATITPTLKKKFTVSDLIDFLETYPVDEDFAKDVPAGIGSYAPRQITECIALAPESSPHRLDSEFERDLNQAVQAQRESLMPAS